MCKHTRLNTKHKHLNAQKEKEEDLVDFAAEALGLFEELLVEHARRRAVLVLVQQPRTLRQDPAAPPARVSVGCCIWILWPHTQCQYRILAHHMRSESWMLSGRSRYLCTAHLRDASTGTCAVRSGSTAHHPESMRSLEPVAVSASRLREASGGLAKRRLRAQHVPARDPRVSCQVQPCSFEGEKESKKVTFVRKLGV